MSEDTVLEIQLIETEIETKKLTLLVVEDDLLSREMLLLQLEGLFFRILEATDGNEGFHLFTEFKPDIVLTDQTMPGLSGLGLMQKIRSSGIKTPVILMTSSIDNQFLLEAINSGVDRFVPKPFDFNLLLRTLNNVAQEIINAQLLEQHRQQEVELLRYRNTYNSMQQELSLSKERHIVRHDHRYRALAGAGGARWGINVVFSPRDIICGDGYSIRTLFDNRQLIFIADAMGSGMSASLTAMLTTSFCNYQIDYLHLWENFTLAIFLERFKKYLASVLLEEEVLSCGFLLVDLVKQEITTALFALPTLLVRDMDGTVRIIRGENPPLGIYPYDVKIGTISLSGVSDLLVMTDGVTDALLPDGGTYREEIEKDFRSSPTLAAFLRRFAGKTYHEDLDDLTLLHLRRLDLNTEWSWTIKADVTMEGTGRKIQEFLDALTVESGLADIERDEVEATLTEVLANAHEHGCQDIDSDEETEFLPDHAYEDALPHKDISPNTRSTLTATLWRGAEKPLLTIEVRDYGPEAPDDALNTATNDMLFNSRGLSLISSLNDSVFIGETCGSLTILKTIEGGDTNAD